MWVKHNKTPGWFRALPPGEQAFLMAADIVANETSSGAKKPAPKKGTTTMSLQQLAALAKE